MKRGVIMIKPDWKVFEAKFSENPQSNFEWLCYILFCLEFKKETGIFRYKNQSGIETNPISMNEDTIGWQAKFYDTTLSAHKKELIESLVKSKRDYPQVNKILFYTNQEWGQSHHFDKPEQNDPQAKIDIETKANELEIRVEWRTASFFESPFVTLENELIAKHFFTFEMSIFQLLLEKKSHTESILEGIQTSITYRDKSLEINRTNLLQDILDKIEREQVLIVTGMGGVGKTAVIKKLYEDKLEETINERNFKFMLNEIQIKQDKLIKKRDELKNLNANNGDVKELLKKHKPEMDALLNGKTIDRKLVETLIDKIVIMEDENTKEKNVQVYFKFHKY